MPLTIFIAHPSSLLTDHKPHGDGLLAFRFISELAARGHQVHVAAENVDLSCDLRSNLHIYTLGSVRPRKSIERLRYMWRMRRLFAALQRNETFDVIHQLNPVHAGLTLALADVQVPVVLGPYVPDWADRDSGLAGFDALVHSARDRGRGLVAELQQRRATAALLSTPAAGAKLAPGAREGLQVHELPYGIDADVWVPDATRKAGHDVLFIGRLHVHKGIYVLLDSFESLASTLPTARLLIAGAGPAAADFAQRVRQSPVRDQIRLLGALDRQQTLQATRSCDVYCLPSLGEPFGLGALEAMACAKPVVATDAGGLSYLVDDMGGWRVPPGDAERLASALREILTDPVLQRSMGQHNRQIVDNRYAWPHVIDRLEQIYAQVIAASGGDDGASGLIRKRSVAAPAGDRPK